LNPILHRTALKTFALFLVVWLPFVANAAPDTVAHPVVVSAQVENGSLVYKVNGRKVEDNKENSLLTNLAQIVKERGTEIPVFIIIDVRAPFTEMGKLETALDKADLVHSRRLFVADFRSGRMNEIHWDETPIPVPAQ
jgi:hypothetical protein